MEVDFPFKVEYSKSSRASCKGCKNKIEAGILRIAVMVQVRKNQFLLCLFDILTLFSLTVLEACGFFDKASPPQTSSAVIFALFHVIQHFYHQTSAAVLWLVGLLSLEDSTQYHLCCGTRILSGSVTDSPTLSPFNLYYGFLVG